MFHLLRLQTAFCLFIALLCQAIGQKRSTCDDRHPNIYLSIMQQVFFNCVASFICSEAFATFRAITIGITGGKTLYDFIRMSSSIHKTTKLPTFSSYSFLSYGFSIFNAGLTIYLYGDDYGKDPRCFIGWENETKSIFFYHILTLCAVRSTSSILLAHLIIAISSLSSLDFSSVLDRDCSEYGRPPNSPRRSSRSIGVPREWPKHHGIPFLHDLGIRISGPIAIPGQRNGRFLAHIHHALLMVAFTVIGLLLVRISR